MLSISNLTNIKFRSSSLEHAHRELYNTLKMNSIGSSSEFSFFQKLALVPSVQSMKFS